MTHDESDVGHQYPMEFEHHGFRVMVDVDSGLGRPRVTEPRLIGRVHCFDSTHPVLTNMSRARFSLQWGDGGVPAMSTCASGLANPVMPGDVCWWAHVDMLAPTTDPVLAITRMRQLVDSLQDHSENLGRRR